MGTLKLLLNTGLSIPSGVIKVNMLSNRLCKFSSTSQFLIKERKDRNLEDTQRYGKSVCILFPMLWVFVFLRKDEKNDE